MSWAIRFGPMLSPASRVLLSSAVFGWTLVISAGAQAFGNDPPLPAQPTVDGECIAVYTGQKTVSGTNATYSEYSCSQELPIRDAQGEPIYPPYTRTTTYMCFGDGQGEISNLCQKIQTVSDPEGIALGIAGNRDFTYNEYQTVYNQLVWPWNQAGSPDSRGAPKYDPLEDVTQESTVHAIFLRMIANDPKIKDAKREFAGEEDPVLNAHLFCKHTKNGVDTGHPYATEDDGVFSPPGSNYTNYEVEGQFFQTDDDIASALDIIASKIKLRMIDAEAG